MINTYLILNRKAHFIIFIFILNIIFLFSLVTYGINTYYYQSYYNYNSIIHSKNSLFYLEVFIPESEVNEITSKNIIIINKDKYYYTVKKTNHSITYKDNTNYQKIYLEVINLDKRYLKNNYHIAIKIPKEKKKIIEYIKE